MTLCLTDEIESIASRVTGRNAPHFAADIAAHDNSIRSMVSSRRILVVGGAGSIGAATIASLVEYDPAVLAVLDVSENNGVELLRSLRSGAPPFRGELVLQPLDYGSPLAAAWLAAQQPFDLVLSFAALKHVRSGRDPWSILRMAEVNLLSADRFLAACRRHGHGRDGVFMVSTDKAARPVSLMGATKRVMELMLWWHAQPGSPASLLSHDVAPHFSRATSTRFANVAFSDGSLPWGFLQRLAKHQPLAAPELVRRYLVSPREAGQLCLLAALAPDACPHRHLLIPRLDPQRDAVGFDAIAEALLAERGWDCRRYTDETEALANLESDLVSRHWPLVLTQPDTDGEKLMEEFVADGERSSVAGSAVERIEAPSFNDGSTLIELFSRLHNWAGGSSAPPARDALAAAFATLIPDLRPGLTGASLDGRM